VLLAGAARARVQPGFNPRDVVKSLQREREGSTGAALDSGGFLIDTSITSVRAPGDQEEPAVAFDGTNFLVVWQDARAGFYDIYAARVSPAGIVLDSSAIAVSSVAAGQRFPAVVFDGTDFLVVWSDERNGAYDIYGARVTPAGTVLDPSGIPVSTAASDQWYPAVAFDGTNCIVVWQDYRNGGYDIYGARVTPAGIVLDPSGIPVSTVMNGQWYPAVTFDGANFLVVWTDERNLSYDIYMARVTPSGSVLDPSGIPVSMAVDWQAYPAVAFDGTNSLVVWQDYRNGSYDIYAARVTPGCAVLDPSGIPVSTAANGQRFPAVAFDGTDFQAVWQDYRNGSFDVYGARISSAGTVLDPSGIPVSTAANGQRYPALACDGANCLAVWPDYRSGSYDIYGARITPAGTILDPEGILISLAAHGQHYPAAAFGSTDFQVVWQDSRMGSYDLYAARVTPTGVVRDPSGFPVSAAAAAQRYPAVAFDGTNFLVAWPDYRAHSYDIYAARVSPAGVVLDPSGIPVSVAANPQSYPAVAFNGTNFLIVWQDARSGSFSDIYAARVTPSGTVLDPSGIPVSTAANDQWYPVCASDGSDFLVAWQDFRSGSYDVYGARVTSAGMVLDPSGIPVSTAANSQSYPVLGYDGANFLVAWADDRARVDNTDIYCARVSAAGSVLDPDGVEVCAAADNQTHPAVCFDGVNSLIVWTDERNGSGDIYGAWVTPGGGVLGGGAVVRGEGNQTYPAVARATGGQIMMVYEGWTWTVAGRAYNGYRTWGKLDPVPGVEEPTLVSLPAFHDGTIMVRGVLFLPPMTDGGNTSSRALLDASGRWVADLYPGPNDIRYLSPGVYFLREAQAQAQAVRRVVVTR
jgi:hypothetical protein